MHASEPLAAGTGRDNHLCRHLCPDQRAPAPFVLVAGKWITHFNDPELMWKVLALSTTFAGNLTIVGSVANMIVIESARQHLEVSFWDYARLGIPITILTIASGVILLLVVS